MNCLSNVTVLWYPRMQASLRSHPTPTFKTVKGGSCRNQSIREGYELPSGRGEWVELRQRASTKIASVGVPESTSVDPCKCVKPEAFSWDRSSWVRSWASVRKTGLISVWNMSSALWVIDFEELSLLLVLSHKTQESRPGVSRDRWSKGIPCVGAMKIGSPGIKIPEQQVCVESPLQEILAFWSGAEGEWVVSCGFSKSEWNQENGVHPASVPWKYINRPLPHRPVL